MSDGSFPDVSRLVSLIMENPALIEQISALAKQDGKDSEQKSPVTAEPSPVPTPKKDDSAAVSSTKYTSSNTVSRTQLLTALKPYISKERADAIDSMISIGEIIDMMKSR